MEWNFALSQPRQLEAALLGAGFRDVLVTREIRKVPFDSLGDFWAAMEAGGGLSGATHLALSPDDRQAVRDRVQRSLLSPDSDGPFSVETEILLGSGRH
jgi:hypothetical protein